MKAPETVLPCKSYTKLPTPYIPTWHRSRWFGVTNLISYELELVIHAIVSSMIPRTGGVSKWAGPWVIPLIKMMTPIGYFLNILE